MAFLKGRLKDELVSKKKNSGWIVDDSRDWMKPPERFHPKMFMDLDNYPYGYEWDGNVWKKAISWQDKLRAAAIRYRESIPEVESAHEEPKPVFEQPSLFDMEYTCRECGEKTKDWVTKYDSRTCLCRKCAYKEKN
jgi:formylmethanofuran dehydrogenase subunit E